MTGNDCGCGERREYMTLGEYMALYPNAYAEATEQMTERQKRLFELRFSERLLFLPKDETSEQAETLTITENVSADTVTPDENNPVETTPGGSFFWRYDVSDDAEAPTIAVEGAQYVKTDGGSLYVYDVISNVSISVQAALKTYQVTVTAVSGTANPERATIQARGTATITITPDTNYELSSVTASGATVSRNGNVITLSNPTGAVTVAAACTRIFYDLLISAFNCTYSPNYKQVAAGGTYAITFVANAGYDLPEIVTASGAQYSWKQSTGVLTVYNPTDKVIAFVRANAKSYSITANITNGTATGANTISTGQTVALTIAANEGYNLPDTATVTGASQSWNKETGTLTLSNPTGAVTVQAVCEAAVTYPVKGDLITIETKQYRVLKTTGSVAEVLAMYDSTTSQKFDSSGDSNVYANSSLDAYLSQTFYNSLSTAMQNALVAKTFQQDSWYYGSNSSAIAKYNGTYQATNNYALSLMSTTFGTSISRKCYVLSCQDVIDYLEVTTVMGLADTTLTSENVWRMFWNQTSSPGSTYPWLRSPSSGSSRTAFFVSGSDGDLDGSRVGLANAVRPAFQIDLSKVEWRKT